MVEKLGIKTPTTEKRLFLFLLHVTVEHIIVLPGYNALMSNKEHNSVFWVTNISWFVVKCHVQENISQMYTIILAVCPIANETRNELSQGQSLLVSRTYTEKERERKIYMEREREREREREGESLYYHSMTQDCKFCGFICINLTCSTILKVPLCW